jgi:carbonic anhydrase
MIKIYNILLITALFHFSISDDDYKKKWRSYPACQIGRLQSPIEIKEYESIYANNFSFVYQSYKGSATGDKIQDSYALMIKEITDGGYINFERGGVIKQYQLKRAELYPALHIIDKEEFKYELHLIHEKNLDFVTNKNQYRSIQDANMYLVIVLRYSECQKSNEKCISDNGLLSTLNEKKDLDLNKFNVFQDKRAYFYEGSFLHIPCDENVNYYVVKDFFYFGNLQIDNLISLGEKDIVTANKFGRPVYKNFMNYKEVLGNNYFSFKKIVISFLFIIILL